MTLKRAVFGGTLLFLAITTLLWFWLLHTASGAAWVWGGVVSRSNGMLSGQLLGGDFANGIEIQDLHVKTEAVTIATNIRRLAINVDLLPLTVNVDALRVADMTVQTLSSDDSHEPAKEIEAVLTDLRLPLRLDVTNARFDDTSIRVDTADPIVLDHIQLSMSWHNNLQLRELTVHQEENSASLVGELHLPVPSAVNFVLTANYESLTIGAMLVGELPEVRIDDIAVSGELIELHGSADVDLGNQPTVTGKLRLTSFDPSKLADAWPSLTPISGDLEFAATPQAVRVWDTVLKVERTASTVQIDASYDFEAESVVGDVAASTLQWPLDTDEPQVSSKEAVLSLSGTPDDWTVSGTVAVATADMPDGRFMLESRGNRDALSASIQEGSVFGGSVIGQLEYSWRESQSWRAELDILNIQTGNVLPDWPGQLSGMASAQGALQPFSIAAQLQDVVGDIRGDELQAEGNVAFADSIFTAEKLLLRHGAATLQLDGSTKTANGMAFRASVDALERYTDFAAGAVLADGRVSQIGATPFLSLNASSDELRLGPTRLVGVQITDERPEDALAGFSLRADNVVVAEQQISDVTVSTRVREDEQTLALQGTLRDAVVAIALRGAFDEWHALPDSPWRGDVEQLEIDLGDQHSFHLSQPASLLVSADRVTLGETCLADEESARLCMRVARTREGEYDAAAELVEVPLALLEHFADLGLDFDQRISGSVNLDGGGNAGPTGAGLLQVSAGNITSNEQPESPIATGVSDLSFDIQGGELLVGKLVLPLPGTGAIAGGFQILDVNNVANSPIEGHVDAVLTDIGVAAYFSPLVDSASGELMASFAVSGTATDPIVEGSVDVRNAAVAYLPIGLRLEEIVLNGTLAANRSLDISGTFRAGDGYGEIVSSADYSNIEEPGIRFKVQGKDLALVNVADIQLTAEPDFEVEFSGDSLRIDGSILIPAARVSPSSLAESRVNESEDVVVVAGKRAGESENSKPAANLEYSGTLQVELGDQVVVDLDVAKANLSGKAAFEWRGASLPVANGRYDLKGNIQAFGQVLSISEGVIRFANVPASQPYLRIRAEREIYGNSQVKRAGVLVDGVASQPTIKAYTQPLTTEERALTLLVTGSDFDYEQGVGAVDFGTYIAPRLFVSYGVGIFDSENIISARYDLARGFGIKASSGSNASGIDINYRFER